MCPNPIPRDGVLVSVSHRCQLKKKSSAKYPIPAGVLCKCADKHRIGNGALTKHAYRCVRKSCCFINNVITICQDYLKITTFRFQPLLNPLQLISGDVCNVSITWKISVFYLLSILTYRLKGELVVILITFGVFEWGTDA